MTLKYWWHFMNKIILSHKVNTLEIERKILYAISLIEKLLLHYSIKLKKFKKNQKNMTIYRECRTIVDKKIKEERTGKLIALGEKLHNEFIKSNLNKSHNVLFEKRNSEGLFEGYTENYIKVCIDSDIDLTDRIENIIYAFELYDINNKEIIRGLSLL